MMKGKSRMEESGKNISKIEDDVGKREPNSA